MSTMPTTDRRMMGTIVLAFVTTIGVLSLSAVERAPSDVIVGIIYAYLAAQGGFDYRQFAKKRETFTPEALRGSVLPAEGEVRTTSPL